MKNYIQPGNTITLAAPYEVNSGDGLLVGSIFGVASGAALNGTVVEATLVGVFDLTKVGSQAWSIGDAIYWDNTAKNCTKTASGNTKIGVAVAAVDNAAGSTIGSVRLNGSF
jgi:predicted RecA/RadA family phage recombinase